MLTSVIAMAVMLAPGQAAQSTVCPVMGSPIAQGAELNAQVERVQAVLAGFPSHVRKEFSLLLGLLGM